MRSRGSSICACRRYFPDGCGRTLAERWGGLVRASRAGRRADWDAMTGSTLSASSSSKSSAHAPRRSTSSYEMRSRFDKIDALVRRFHPAAHPHAQSVGVVRGRIVRDELRHLVVDEFQDVNGAQLAFLRELSPPSASRDLCVVGDDDQAIYGFRGSDDRAFQHFTEKSGPMRTTVPLTENYRSSEAVLETAQKVIGRIARSVRTRIRRSRRGREFDQRCTRSRSRRCTSRPTATTA